VWPNPKVKEMVAEVARARTFGTVEEVAYPCIFSLVGGGELYHGGTIDRRTAANPPPPLNKT